MQIPNAHTMKENLGQLLMDSRLPSYTTPLLSASAMRQTLHEVLIASNTDRLLFNDAATNLNAHAFVIETPLYNLPNFVKDSVYTFFTQLIDELNVSFAGNTSETIGCTRYWDIFDTYTDWAGPHTQITIWEQLELAGSFPVELQEEVIVSVLDRVPFENIYAELSESIDSLSDRTKQTLAKDLFTNLHLGARGSRYKPFVKGRVVICIIGTPSECRAYETIRDVSAIQIALDAVSADARLSPAHSVATTALLNALSVIDKQGGDIASYTIFKGGHLRIRCFKKHYQFEFSHPFFEALVAFICLHGDDAMQEPLFELLGQTPQVA